MLSPRALSLAAPLVLAALCPAQTVLLRFKPPVGKTMSYVTTVSMSQNIPGSPTPMAFSQVMPIAYRVVSRSAKGTTLETKIGKVRVDLPPNSPMASRKAQMESATSGMVSTTVVDEFGKLVSMGSKGAAASAMANQMGSGMMAGAQGVSYPKQALKVGDAWSASVDMGKILGQGPAGASGMKATGKIQIAYRLVSLEKRGGTTLATLSLATKGTTKMTMPGGGAQGMTMKMSGTGKIVVDAATGLLQSMTNTSDTNMAIMGNNMKQHMVMTMKTK